MNKSAVVLLFSSFLAASSAFADAFSSVTNLKNAAAPQWGLASVHGTLMPDGTVLFIGTQRSEQSPTSGPDFVARYSVVPAGVPVPDTQELMLETVPFDCTDNCVFPGPDGTWTAADGLFCAGHTLLEDGTFFALSGSRFWSHIPTVPDDPNVGVLVGLDYNLTFNANSNNWTRLPGQLLSPGSSGLHGRWYGTAIRLADRRILEISGYDQVAVFLDGVLLPGTQAFNISVEAYDPNNPTDPRNLLSDEASTPEGIFNSDYTHAFQMPFPLESGQDVIMLGESGEPFLMEPSTTPKWLPVGQIRPGLSGGASPGHGQSTLMLPLRLTQQEWGYALGAIMTIGGGGEDHEHFADIYDLINGGWQSQRIDIGLHRHHPSTVILPDGSIFVIGGHGGGAVSAAPLSGALLTPSATGFTVTATAEMSTPRGYHTVTLLLPDGRVLVGGGRTGGVGDISDEQPTLEYYEPDYMNGPRPSIISAPQEIRYDEPFAMQFSGASNVDELVLLSLGSMTHSFDANQRSIELFHSQVTADIVYGYLAGGERFTPPGYYMLFLLDENRVPSEAKIVKVTRP